MSQTAYQTQYRQEFIAGFEKRQSLLRNTCVTETQVNGNEAVFLVADSGGADAVTRGVNGDIPTRSDNLNQFTCTLKEWHDVPERTNFNIFASQGNGRRIMQETSMAVINRKIDSDIRTALSAATTTWGAATTATFALVKKVRTTLATNNADKDAALWAVISPAFYGELLDEAQFTSIDYVQDRKFEGVDKSKAFNWFGVNWIVDSGIAGVGTTNARCYMYSQNAIGHACDMERIATFVGYDDKNDKSWARCTAYMGSKLLQNSGVIVMPHDDSALTL